DRLPLGEGEGPAAKLDEDALLFPAYEEALDGPGARVVGVVVFEPGEGEVPAQLVVDSTQDIKVEPGSHPLGVVVSQKQDVQVFFQVEADEDIVTDVQGAS